MMNIISTIFIFSFISLILGLGLYYISDKYKEKEYSILHQIEEILPQSQCGQCGYPGCLPYAEAIINKKEKIDKCFPGGKDVFLKLKNLLHIDNIEYNADSLPVNIIHKTVFIDEKNCVGCFKCRKVCPVDAIVGSLNLVHTVLTNVCTGCNLCIPICPFDCIYIKNIPCENNEFIN